MIMTAVTYQVPITLKELQEGTGDRQRAASPLRGGSPPRLSSPIFLPAQPKPPHSSPSGPPLLSLPRGIHEALSSTVPRADANAILLRSGAVPCRCEWQTCQQGAGLGFGQKKEASVKEVTLLGSPGPAPAARLHQDAWWSRAGLQTSQPRDPYWLSFLLDGQLQRQGTTQLKAALPASSSEQKGGTQAPEYDTMAARFSAAPLLPRWGN